MTMNNSSPGNQDATQSDPNALRKQTFEKPMKKSSPDNQDATQSDPNALRKQTFEKTGFQSNRGDQIDNYSLRHLRALDRSLSCIAPPPQDVSSSPLSESPWSSHVASDNYAHTGLRGSLVREEGHIYSLAAARDLLYTGSESKHIRVWKNQKEFSGFRSNSGLVKAIVIADDQVFSGHQDGKIRIWRPLPKNPALYKRIGSMPTFKAKIKSSFKPSIKHLDPVSCLALSEDKSLLYSGSWDRNFKVWRVSDSKCLESVKAHDDAVNSIIAAFGGTVFTGSADGSIRVWKREFVGNKGKTKHNMSRTLLQQDSAVTALAVDPSTAFLYGGSSDGIVIFWKMDKTSGLSHGGVLRGHKLAVLCLATAGILVFSGSADTNICVWRRDSGGTHTCLSVLIGYGGPVKCLAVEEEWGAACRDSRQYIVYSGSIDKSVKIWRATDAPAMMQPPPTSLRRQVEDHNNSWADFSSVEVGE